MKDIHDRHTQDLATIDSSFGLHPKHSRPPAPLSREYEREIARYAAYLREKPYLAEALRRSDK